jgi:hypothetical protein
MVCSCTPMPHKGLESVKGDTATIGGILAEDFTDVSLTGEVVGKVQVLADIKAERGPRVISI